MSSLMETSLIHSDRLLSRNNFPLASIPEEEEERERAAHHMLLHGSTPARSVVVPSEGRVQTRPSPDLSVQSSFTLDNSGSSSQATLYVLGDKECKSCERSPTHKLVPCEHTLCFNHLLLGRDLDASKLSTCVYCDQVTFMHLLTRLFVNIAYVIAARPRDHRTPCRNALVVASKHLHLPLVCSKRRQQYLVSSVNVDSDPFTYEYLNHPYYAMAS